MPAGRPRLINSPEEMLATGHAYFEQCNESKEPILITGLALALGLSGREALSEYGRRPEYSAAVKELKSVCERFAEARLYGNSPTGAIFALKNYGWKDNFQVGGDPDGVPVQAEVKVTFVDAASDSSQR